MSVLYPLIQALVLFAVAPLLSGITRVARARLHNRRGPGVLQEYRDIIKLLGRQSVGPDASGWVFRLTPYVMVGVMLTIATALPVVTVGSPLPQLGDLITLLYLFAIARFFFAISGLDTGSPFTAIGASREAMLGVLVEPMLLLGLWVAAQVAGSTNRIKSFQWMFISLAARQRLPPRCTALRWRSACWSRKFTPVGRVSRMNNRRRFCMAIWCSRCA